MSKSNLVYNPKYIQIALNLEQKINQKAFKAGDALPPERELSAMFDVNRLTLRKAIDELVQKGLVVRKHGIGTFVAIPKKKNTKICVMNYGYLWHLVSGDFYGKIFKGIEISLEEEMAHLVLKGAREQNLETFFESLKEDNVDGIILLGVMQDELILKIKSFKIPMVLVDYMNPEINVDSMVVDNVEGAKKIVEHLISLNHKNILYVGGSRGGKKSYVEIEQSSVDRQRGYSLALKNAGIENDLVVNTFLSYKDAYDSTIVKLKEYPKITAIFAFDDHMALGAMDAAKSLGFRVPEDISVAGFGNTWGSYKGKLPSNFKLTTADVPSLEKVGQNAVGILLKSISDKRHLPEISMIDVNLLLGNSTGLAP